MNKVIQWGLNGPDWKVGSWCDEKEYEEMIHRQAVKLANQIEEELLGMVPPRRAT